MNKVSLRVFLLTLLGVFVLGITEAVASSSNRSYASAMLRSDAPTGSGKVYVGANATSSPNYQTSSSYESSNTTSTFHFYAQATTGYVFTGWYDKSADAGYTAIAQSTVDEVTYS